MPVFFHAVDFTVGSDPDAPLLRLHLEGAAPRERLEALHAALDWLRGQVAEAAVAETFGPVSTSPEEVRTTIRRPAKDEAVALLPLIGGHRTPTTFDFTCHRVEGGTPTESVTLRLGIHYESGSVVDLDQLALDMDFARRFSGWALSGEAPPSPSAAEADRSPPPGAD